MYVVVQRHFDYDDEVHYVRSKGGSPLAVFISEAEAENYALRLTVEGFFPKYGNLESFGYEMGHIFRIKPTFITIPSGKFFGEFDVLNRLEKILDIRNRSREDLYELANCLSHDIKPYYVETVPFKGESS